LCRPFARQAGEVTLPWHLDPAPHDPGAPHLGTHHPGIHDPDSPDHDVVPFRLGATPAERAEAGRLRREGLARTVIRDVLVAIDAPDSPAVRAVAVVLLTDAPFAAGLRDGEFAVSFGTAAWVYSGGPEPGEVELVAGAGFRWRPTPWIRIRTSAALPPQDVVLVGGVRVTSPARTAADLARTLPAPDAREILARLEAATAVTPQDTLDQLARMPNARGSANARKLLRAEIRTRETKSEPGSGKPKTRKRRAKDT
jgi:hypothetical protein